MDIERKAIMEILSEIEDQKSYSNIAINHYLNKNNIKEAAFIREVVYGVLENKLYIDYVLSHFIKTSLNKIKTNALSLLRMGIYQLAFMNVPEYAAVNECVNLAKKFTKGQYAFINAVLRNYIRKKDEIKLPDKETRLIDFLSVKYSYEKWIIKMWLDSYDKGFVEDLLKDGNETPEFTIRINPLKINKEEIINQLTQKKYEVTEGKYVKEALNIKGSGLLNDTLFKEGKFAVQDESSMIAVNVLNPQPGEFILDVCAAPGGKTIYTAEKMQNNGRIIASDIHPHKVELLNQTAQKHGIKIIEARVFDALNLDRSLIGKADRVLVDVPCSGLGVIRRKPEIKYSKQENDIEALSKIQYQILSNASRYLKKGGILVYSTCTISEKENQKIINRFIEENTTFSIDKNNQADIMDIDINGMIQLFPNIHHIDGFFICKLIKNE